jgi:type I restriction enzyme S subunit
MEVKPGYKMTEVGVIPEEWGVMPFIRAIGSYIDYRGRTPRKLGLDWGGGDILALSANNVQMGKIDTDKEAYLASEELYQRWMVQGQCEFGDILLTMEAPLGNVAQIPDSRKYILSQRVLLVKPVSWICKDFFAHYMRGAFFQGQLSQNSTGSTAKGIQRRKLDNLPIYLPLEKAEQEAIASALSDVDALIESLEQLVVKKRNIKQGAMQELLTGKRRLPGFSGEWVVRRLGEMSTLYQPVTIPARDFTDSGYPVYGANGVVGYYDKYNHEAWQVTVTCRGSTCGTVNRTVNKCWITGNAMVVDCETKKIVNKLFVYQLLIAADLSICITGTGQPQIVRTPLARIEFKIPQDKKEQLEISAVIEDMDNDLLSLEIKLSKTRHLKQAMMQELLTGRIRLV